MSPCVSLPAVVSILMLWLLLQRKEVEELRPGPSISAKSARIARRHAAHMAEYQDLPAHERLYESRSHQAYNEVTSFPHSASILLLVQCIVC